MDVITRMERMIENEPSKVRRWAMRRELFKTIKQMEDYKS